MLQQCSVLRKLQEDMASSSLWETVKHERINGRHISFISKTQQTQQLTAMSDGRIRLYEYV